MIFEQLFETETSTFTYLVADEVRRAAALFDPVREEISRYMELLDLRKLRLEYVFDTHIHADHVTAAGELRERTGALTALHESARAECVDLRLRDGAFFKVGEVPVQAIHTPGHTPCHLSYVVNGDRVLTGDSLLIGGCGRTDFQGGDAGDLYDAITGRLFRLPDDYWVYPGHDYRGNSRSTIGHEKVTNPRLAGRSRDEFIELMGGLGLAPPKHIMEAVPANERCGRQEVA